LNEDEAKGGHISRLKSLINFAQLPPKPEGRSSQAESAGFGARNVPIRSTWNVAWVIAVVSTQPGLAERCELGHLALRLNQISDLGVRASFGIRISAFGF
jgi:hypothetical protein